MTFSTNGIVTLRFVPAWVTPLVEHSDPLLQDRIET